MLLIPKLYPKAREDAKTTTWKIKQGQLYLSTIHPVKLGCVVLLCNLYSSCQKKQSFSLSLRFNIYYKAMIDKVIFLNFIIISQIKKGGIFCNHKLIHWQTVAKYRKYAQPNKDITRYKNGKNAFFCVVGTYFGICQKMWMEFDA